MHYRDRRDRGRGFAGNRRNRPSKIPSPEQDTVGPSLPLVPRDGPKPIHVAQSVGLRGNQVEQVAVDEAETSAASRTAACSPRGHVRMFCALQGGLIVLASFV